MRRRHSLLPYTLDASAVTLIPPQAPPPPPVHRPWCDPSLGHLAGQTSLRSDCTYITPLLHVESLLAQVHEARARPVDRPSHPVQRPSDEPVLPAHPRIQRAARRIHFDRPLHTGHWVLPGPHASLTTLIHSHATRSHQRHTTRSIHSISHPHSPTYAHTPPRAHSPTSPPR